MTSRLSLSMAAAALSVACLGFVAGGPPFLKWAEAKKQAQQTGKPIMVYSVTDQQGNGAGG